MGDSSADLTSRTRHRTPGPKTREPANPRTREPGNPVSDQFRPETVMRAQLEPL